MNKVHVPSLGMAAVIALVLIVGYHLLMHRNG